MQNTSDSFDDKNWVCVGAVTGAHGIRGEVRIKLFLEDIDRLQDFDGFWRDQGETPIVFKLTKQIKNGFAIRIEGVTNRNEAEALRGQKIWARRDALEPVGEDEFYFSDLEGLDVVDAGGKPLGRVVAMQDYGAGGVVEIALIKPHKGIGKTAMVPFDREVVTDIDLDKGQMTVLLTEWLEGEIVVTPEAQNADDED